MAHFILSIYFPVYLKVIGHEDPVYLLRTGVYFGHPYLPPATQPFRSFFPQRTLTRRDDPKKRAKVNSPKRGFLKTFLMQFSPIKCFSLEPLFSFCSKMFRRDFLFLVSKVLNFREKKIVSTPPPLLGRIPVYALAKYIEKKRNNSYRNSTITIVSD